MDVNGWVVAGVIALGGVVLTGFLQQAGAESFKAVFRRLLSLGPVNRDAPSAPGVSLASQPAEHGDGLHQKIVSDIRSAPIMQKAKTGHAFVGLRVRWHLRLISISNLPDNRVNLFLFPADVMEPTIRATVDLGTYPELALLKQLAPVTITGQLTKVDQYEIQIGQPSVFFSELA